MGAVGCRRAPFGKEFLNMEEKKKKPAGRPRLQSAGSKGGAQAPWGEGR